MKYIFYWTCVALISLAILQFVSGCASIPATPPVVAPPAVVEKPFASWPNQEWAKEALATVRREGLDKLPLSDAKAFCPNGMSERNWVHLMASMVRYESNFKPNTTYKESFKSSSSGDYVISTGLFQISISSTRGGYGCVWSGQEDLKNPIKNIACSGKVLKKLVAQDGRMAGSVGGKWKGAARYWSVLRVDAKTKAHVKQWCE